MAEKSSQIKTKTSIALFFAAIAIGALMIWFFAAGPSAIESVPPQTFTSESEVGKIVYEQLSKKIYGHKLLVIGIPPQPEKYEQVVREIVTQLSTQNPKVLLLKEPKWSKLDLPANVEIADFDLNDEEIATQAEPLRRAMQTEMVVIYSVSIYSTHLIPGNAIRRLEEVLGEKIPSITFAPLVLRPEFENENEPACVGSMRDYEGLYNLGCAQVYISRKTYKELYPLNEKRFTLTEQAPGDYILQLHSLKKN